MNNPSKINFRKKKIIVFLKLFKARLAVYSMMLMLLIIKKFNNKFNNLNKWEVIAYLEHLLLQIIIKIINQNKILQLVVLVLKI